MRMARLRLSADQGTGCPVIQCWAGMAILLYSERKGKILFLKLKAQGYSKLHTWLRPVLTRCLEVKIKMPIHIKKILC